MKLELTPIGLIHSPHHQAEGTPIQPRWAAGIEGTVEVFPVDRIGWYANARGSRTADGRFAKGAENQSP